MPAARVVGHDAAARGLLGPLGKPGDRDRELGIEALPRGGRHAQRGSGVVVEAGGTQEHRVADVLGQGQRPRWSCSSRPPGPGRRRPPRRGRRRAPRRRTARRPCARPRCAAATARRRRPRHARSSAAGVRGAQRLDRRARAVGPARRSSLRKRRSGWPAGHLVAAVGADDAQRLVSSAGARTGSMSSVPSSAHCRSSRKTAAGARPRTPRPRVRTAPRGRRPTAAPRSGSAVVSGQ